MKWAQQTRHGESRHDAQTAEYGVWMDMRKRCRNPTHRAFKYYGGKGITVCDRWHVYENFLSDMGRRPSPKHSIERNDSNGNYESSNCRWATKIEQMRNKSDNRMLTYEGKTMCVAAWAEHLGISVNTIRKRLYTGHAIERVLSTQRHTRAG
jgi:hypothetical protein